MYINFGNSEIIVITEIINLIDDSVKYKRSKQEKILTILMSYLKFHITTTSTCTERSLDCQNRLVRFILNSEIWVHKGTTTQTDKFTLNYLVCYFCIHSYSCFTYPTTCPGGACTSNSCRQQKQHHPEHRSGLSKWITSTPLLSVIFMANGLSGPQHCRTRQLESARNGDT